MRRVLRAAMLTVAATVGVLVLTATPASAHAALLSASPGPGSNLPQAPGEVVLRFSEPVDLATSRIAVTGAGEVDATAGPTRGVPGDTRSLRRALALLQPGRYTVRWTSVSRDDGHLETGDYTFAIGVVAGTSRHSDTGLFSGESTAALAGHLVALTGLLLWTGLVVVGRAARRAGGVAARLDGLTRAAPAVAALGALVVVADRWRTSPAGLGALTHGRTAQLDLVVLAAAAIGTTATRWRAPGRRASQTAAVCAAIALAAEAASGHAAATSVPVIASVVLSVHLAGVGTWAAAIAASLLSGRAVRTLRATAPYAVTAAVAVLATGVVATTLEVGRWSDLATTGYGRIVLAKAAAFTVVVTAGLCHYWRRRAGADRRRIRRPLRVEALAAGLAVALGAVLSAAPPPVPGTAAVAGTVAVASRVSGLDARHAVSVAGANGPVVVALTLAPPRPGLVHARVRVLSSTPSELPGRVGLTGSAPGASKFDVRLRRRPDPPSGGRTFDGAVRIDRRGLWTFDVALTSTRGRRDVSIAVPLPAPPAAADLARALAREEQLTSAQLHEAVRATTTGPAIVADYTFNAPDALAFTTNGTTEIDLGTRTFRREAPTKPWTSQRTDAAVAWPSPYFRQFWGPGVAARVVGNDVVDGVASRVIAFVRPDLPAWFRLWVGTDGLVRREEMVAQGHLMVHTYSAFDLTPTITAPTITAPV